MAKAANARRPASRRAEDAAPVRDPGAAPADSGSLDALLLPDSLPILPLSERPFFPPQTLPILMNEDPWRDTLDAIGSSEHRLAGLVMVQAAHPDQARAGDFARIGTVVRIHHPIVSSGKIQFIAEGLQRFRIRKWLHDQQPFEASVEYPQEPRYRDTEQLRAYALAIINSLRELAPLNPVYQDELKFFFTRFQPNEPAPLTDFAASLTTASRHDLQAVLETVHLRERMEKVLGLIKQELEIARLQAKIRADVEDKLNEQQRKFFLREQLKVIQKELGIAKDDRVADAERFRARLDQCQPPASARQRIDDELDKLAILETGSPEYAVTRNYLDVITALPWSQTSDDQFDLARARNILDRAHAGLDDIKQRLIEWLAASKLRHLRDGRASSGSVLLLVGPPGVGKTSIGQAIAQALGRKFYRFSVGGMRDEAEIKGHRRTYIGAMPGKLAQALKECGTSNPVIMLDEIDKIGASHQGDPAAALLEALDPEQNGQFLDHYLDTRVDLSRVLFICTANQLDSIPRALLDRMEVLRLAGYISEEKVAIARDHLWPRQLERAGLSGKQVKLDNKTLRALVEGYAREAGVRQLDKLLGRLTRKAAVEVLEHPDAAITIDEPRVRHWLGAAPFQDQKPHTGVGMVTGLAWTALGGSTLTIEAACVHHKQRGLKLTGTLGDVMKESAEIAFSFISAQLGRYGIRDSAKFDNAFVHIHVPEGATPKDGPSAGITLATAMLSLAKGKAPRAALAMTGELTLNGHVLAVGGVREKLVAAKRAGIRIIALPAACRAECEQFPGHILKGLQLHFVHHFDEVAALAFR